LLRLLGANKIINVIKNGAIVGHLCELATTSTPQRESWQLELPRYINLLLLGRQFGDLEPNDVSQPHSGSDAGKLIFINEGRAKTILHEIHRIDEGTALYRVPKGEDNWAHMEDSIPSRNLMYQSACYSTSNADLM
jgi:hypothetical protein